MKQTQCEMVLDMLRANRDGITAQDARYAIGCDRLAARINDLRDRGHWIHSEIIKVPTRYGFTHVARYKLLKGEMA